MPGQADWWAQSPARAPVLGVDPPLAQAATVVDAVVAHSITDVALDLSAANETELEGFYDALGAKINEILVVLENAGIVASS